MAYHNQQGVDTAIARIFNSILADEQVLFDDGRELRREKVSDLAARLAGRAVAAMRTRRRHRTGRAARRTRTRSSIRSTESRCRPSTADGEIVAARASVSHRPSDRRALLRDRDAVRPLDPGHRATTRYSSRAPTGSRSRPVERARSRRPHRDRPPHRRSRARPHEVEHARRLAAREGDPWKLRSRRPGLGERVWEQRKDLFGLLVVRATVTPDRTGATAPGRSSSGCARANRVPLPVLRRSRRHARRAHACVPTHAGRSVSLPARDPRSPTSSSGCSASGSPRAPRTSAARTRSSRSAATDDAARPRRGRSIRRDSACTSSGRRQARRARPSLFVHSKLLLRLVRLPRLRRQPQADPRLDPRAPAQPPQVVRRGLSRGRRCSLGQEVRRGHPTRVLDRLRGAEGRPHRRLRALRPRPVGRPLRDHVQATRRVSGTIRSGASRCAASLRGARSSGTRASTQRLNARAPAISSGRRSTRSARSSRRRSSTTSRCPASRTSGPGPA